MTVMQIVQQLFNSMGITMEIFFVTLVTSLILGLGLALVRMSKNRVLSLIAKFYISVMRGTPLMLQLLVVYFGPFFIFGMQITPSYRLKAVLIGFALNYAAYFAEIFRGGLLSVDKGQYEAAKVLGISEMQTKFKIVMPQMFRISLPAVANETIILLKDTALVSTIGLSDLLDVTKEIVNTSTNVSAYAVAAIFYLALSYVLSILFKKLEGKFSF